jgi:hypothetical protein
VDQTLAAMVGNPQQRARLERLLALPASLSLVALQA